MHEEPQYPTVLTGILLNGYGVQWRMDGTLASQQMPVYTPSDKLRKTCS